MHVNVWLGLVAHTHSVPHKHIFLNKQPAVHQTATAMSTTPRATAAQGLAMSDNQENVDRPLGFLYILRKEGQRATSFPLTAELFIGR